MAKDFKVKCEAYQSGEKLGQRTKKADNAPVVAQNAAVMSLMAKDKVDFENGPIEFACHTQ